MPTWMGAALLLGCLVLAGLMVWLLLAQASLRRALDRQRGASREALEPLIGLQRAQLDSVDRHLNLSQTQANRQLQLMEQTRQEVQRTWEALRRENAAQLEEMRALVDRRLSGQLQQRLDASFSQVSQRLEQVYRGLGEMQHLAQGVGDLKKVLGNVKTRGVFGEVQLQALLEEAFAPAQYEKNAQVKPGSQERVEFAIRLPVQDGGHLLLPIDSKFPRESYLALVQAQEDGDPAAVEECEKAFVQALKVEAKRIRQKYVHPPETTDFAVMFLPTESLYAQAVKQGALCEQLSQEQRVVVAGPSTLLALLNSLQLGFQSVHIQRQSAKVLELLAQVRRELEAYQEALGKTQLRLRQAADSIDEAARRGQALRGRLEVLDKDEDRA